MNVRLWPLADLRLLVSQTRLNVCFYRISDMIRVVGKDFDVQLLITVLLAVGTVGALWYFLKTADQPAPAAVTTDPVPAEIEPELPRYPMPPPAELQQGTGQLILLPPLDDSDAYFKISLVNVFGTDIGELLVEESLIEKFVTTMDNLTRSHISERIRPIGSVSGQFEVDVLDADQEYVLSERNYSRFDYLVTMLANGDLDALFDTYRRFYPLLHEAFVRLGYPKGFLNDRVVEVIDHLLDTPNVEGPIRLARPHVLYEFSDPELEALSSGQKMLLRMGGDHAAQVKQTLRQFRTLITEPRQE